MDSEEIFLLWHASKCIKNVCIVGRGGSYLSSQHSEAEVGVSLSSNQLARVIVTQRNPVSRWHVGRKKKRCLHLY